MPIDASERPVAEDQGRVDLSCFENSWYSPGRGRLVRTLWFFVNAFVFDSWLLPVSAPKRLILRAFGARIGRGVVIKPRVNIKYPWRLSVEDHAWIGEGCWIDNLGDVSIGESACLSQGCLLLCGNHDYRSPRFDLLVGDIRVEEGAWVGARAIVCPGVTVGAHAVLSVASVARSDLARHMVFSGNPARALRPRNLQTM